MGTPHRIVKKPQPLSWGFLLQTTYQTELRIEDGTAFGRERHLTDPAVSSILTMGLPSREMTVSVCRPTVRPGRPHRQQCVVCRPMSQWVTRAFDWARRSRLLSASTGHSPAGYFNRQNAVYAEVRERVLPAKSRHSNWHCSFSLSHLPPRSRHLSTSQNVQPDRKRKSDKTLAECFIVHSRARTVVRPQVAC